MLLPARSLLPHDIDHQEETVRGHEAGQSPEKTRLFIAGQVVHREAGENHVPIIAFRLCMLQQIAAPQFDAVNP